MGSLGTDVKWVQEEPQKSRAPSCAYISLILKITYTIRVLLLLLIPAEKKRTRITFLPTLQLHVFSSVFPEVHNKNNTTRLKVFDASCILSKVFKDFFSAKLMHIQ